MEPLTDLSDAGIDQSDDIDSDMEWDPMLCHDSMRPNWEKEDQEEGKELDGDDLVVLTEGWDDELEDHREGYGIPS